MRVSALFPLFLALCILIASSGGVLAEKRDVNPSDRVPVQNITTIPPELKQSMKSPDEPEDAIIEAETGMKATEMQIISSESHDTGSSDIPLGTVSMDRLQEMTMDDIRYGPYEHAEWIISGGSAGSVDVEIRNLIGDTDHHEGWGLAATVVPGATAYFILPLAVNPDAHIRYLKIVDYLPPYDTDPEIRIRSVEVHNGYETIASYTPEFWVHENERVHIIDLGEYYSFDKGLQMAVAVVNREESVSNQYIITGYGARQEWWYSRLTETIQAP